MGFKEKVPGNLFNNKGKGKGKTDSVNGKKTPRGGQCKRTLQKQKSKKNRERVGEKTAAEPPSRSGFSAG